MAKKYSKWFDGKEYKHNKILKRRYDNIDIVPVYTPALRFNYIKYTIPRAGRFNGELTEMQRRIMGLIATHSFLSIKQIKTYLELQGLDISFSEIGKTLDDLIFYNLVERNVITRRETVYDEDAKIYINTDCEAIRLYSQGCYRPFSNRDFPACQLKNLAILKQDCGNAMPTFALSMHIMNQILLNSMIYTGNVRRFRIAQIKFLPHLRLAIPLEIATDDRVYYFINAVFVPIFRLQEMLRNWNEYAISVKEDINKSRKYRSDNNMKDASAHRKFVPFTVVIIAANSDHLTQIMDVVSRVETSNFNVAFSTYDEWFKKNGGTFFQKEIVK